jgi:hypothetical protein
MGQGTESCQGYEVDYDEYEECPDGYWIQKDGSTIAIESMSVTHMRNARRLCLARAQTANFTGDADSWQDWADAFENAIEARGESASAPPAVYVSPAMVKPTRGAKAKMKCHCGVEYEAREADIKRGWGLSCSKRCSSIRREFGRPKAKRL